MEKIFTFKDVEEKIFSNSKIRKDLPRHHSFFDSYAFARMHPSIKKIAIRSIFSFMDLVNEDEIKIISDILGYKIKISKLNVDTIKNINCNINKIVYNLDDAYNYSEICIYRKNNEVKILCWR
jgi:hypothetical protein